MPARMILARVAAGVGLWSALVLLRPGLLQAQAVSVPVTHEVYDFLQRMESKHLIHDFRDAARPLSRKLIAEKLLELEPSLDRLTRVERKRYEFLRTEFSYEIGAIAGDPEPTDLRWHLGSYGFRGGILNVDPNFRLSYDKAGDQNVTSRTFGFRTYGYLDRRFGYLFNFQWSRDQGSGINPSRMLTPETGIVPQRIQQDFVEYNNTDAQIGVDLDPFELSLEKMQNVWGYGERGSVILSTKAPSYPQIKLRIRVTDWLDFVYFYAELHSDVVDSTLSYYTHSSSLKDFYRIVYRSKYLVAHQLEFTPINGLDISLGESVVYSDRGISLMYLIPIMFFKSAEHYNRDTDNVQMFGSMDVNLLKGCRFYLSVFVDELNTEGIFNPLQERNQVAFTAGVHTYDIGPENTEFILEYTRLNPWVYSHKQPATTFTNNGYDLGDWLGQNGDDAYIEMRSLPLRQLTAGAFWERVRKGGSEDVGRQYMLPSPEFLYGPVKKMSYFGAYARFEFGRDAFIDVMGRWKTASDEASPLSDVKNQFEYSLALRYGLW